MQQLATGRPFDDALVEVALSFARMYGAQDAEDLAQDALLRLLTERNQIRDPVAWLYVVVRRLHARRAHHSTSSFAAPLKVDPWPLIELSLDAQRLSRSLHSRERRSLSLSLAGFSESESAGRLGCSVKATEKSLHRARRQLRHLFTDR